MTKLPDYEDKILIDPLVILERIRLLIHTKIRATYPMMSLADVMSLLVNLRQKENKDLLNYLERFKEERNIAKIQPGKHFLDSSIKNTTEYIKLEKDTERYAAKEAAFTKFMAVLFVQGSNCKIDGKLIEDFRTRYLIGNDEYTKKLKAEAYVMRQMKNTRKNIVITTTEIMRIKGMSQDLHRQANEVFLLWIQISDAGYMSYGG